MYPLGRTSPPDYETGGSARVWSPALQAGPVLVYSNPIESDSLEREMAADGGACIICLDTSPPPIQSGCACRGDSGLAHIACQCIVAPVRALCASEPEGGGC